MRNRWPAHPSFYLVAGRGVQPLCINPKDKCVIDGLRSRSSIIFLSELSEELNSLVFPTLSAVQTRNKDRRRLIRRTGLHLIVRALALVTPIALVFIRRLALVPLQNLLLPDKLFVGQLLPPFGKHIIGRHRRNLFQGEFPVQTPFQESLISNRGLWVNIPQERT